MSIMGALTIATVFFLAIFIAKGIVTRLLAFFIPIEYIEITYKDREGVVHHRKVRMKDDESKEDLIKLINEIKGRKNIDKECHSDW
ncbi:hypothetical protein BFS14_14570 [Serratia fonticola]|uniref:hypothetical protein n=1 Tax=Serratia fonticola TaxID=47917 RepID=UPI0008FCFE57|nr:hypothetical protein [Serratia fonticola]OIX95586.1 hypothetical protein BFS14_14570 [Serratia fonticola]QCR62098.1 hypothetical protein FD644_17830 [Serratia fonticola]